MQYRVYFLCTQCTCLRSVSVRKHCGLPWRCEWIVLVSVVASMVSINNCACREKKQGGTKRYDDREQWRPWTICIREKHQRYLLLWQHWHGVWRRSRRMERRWEERTWRMRGTEKMRRWQKTEIFHAWKLLAVNGRVKGGKRGEITFIKMVTSVLYLQKITAL